MTIARILATATLFLLVGCTSVATRGNPPQFDGPTVDLLQQDWDNMPGVASVGGHLAVGPTGFVIVEQDGSGGQPNPPVNLYGTHLESVGDFQLSVAIADNKGDAAIELYDSVPIVADEFRLDRGSVRFSVTGDQLTITAHDGSAPDGHAVQPSVPSFSQTYPLPNPDDFVVTRIGDTLSVTSGTTEVARTPLGGIFTSNKLWFGVDATRGGFTLAKLTLAGPANSHPVSVDVAHRAGRTVGPDGLGARAAALRPGFQVGAAAALGPYASDAQYGALLADNFTTITPENAMKAQFLAPRQGSYEFGEADALIALARRNGQQVHGHAIAFGEAEPAWMRNLPTDTAADRASSGAALLRYATDVSSHFKDQLVSLDVVNEPFDTDDGPTLQHSVWFKALGPDYASTVIRAVHAAAPNVKLFVNENGIEQPGPRQDAFVDYIARLKHAGVPVDGVGLQAHVYNMDTDAITAEQLDETINRFAALGVVVRISEMDVTDDQGTDAQADQYATVFATCLKNPNCIGWTTWGVDDRYDWFSDDERGVQQGHDLLFNDGSPTEAFNRLVARVAR